MTRRVLMAISCFAILATRGLALLPRDLHPVTLHPLFPFPQIPDAPALSTLGNSLNPGDAKWKLPKLSFPGVLVPKCLSSLWDVDGCILEVTQAYYSGDVTIIGGECCKSVIQVSAQCMLQLKAFTLIPYFPKLVQNFCEQLA
ncbi:uncharacterized protein [Rutidosis leptorrhynchoides]|uniref:uncharacterized protein n=1 Tax=Rutidosis leptorrhynchoides TaxID=125765 RepID=UPI003A993073